MWIVNLTANPNGSHNNHRADNITDVPEGWAVIPDDFAVPESFPFVLIEALNGIVTGMTEGIVPPAPKPEPTWNERIEVQVVDLQEVTAALEDAICEMDAANEERMAAIEDALCEIDMG